MLVGDIISQTAASYPEKIGVVYGDHRQSWRQADQRATRMANGLLALGLQKGERVAILSRNCNQYIEFYFAAAKAGLVSVPLNFWLLPAELSRLINDSSASALIIDENYSDKAAELHAPSLKHYIGLGGNHSYPNDLETMIGENSDQEPGTGVEEDDIFTLAYTSGTTGTPKGAVITHGNSCAAIRTMAHEWRFEPDSVHIMHAPMFVAAGCGSRFHAVLMGSTCIIINFDAERALEVIEKEQATHFSMTPSAIRRIIEHPKVGDYDLSSVRQIGLVGAPHPAAEISKIEETFGHVWYSAWA